MSKDIRPFNDKDQRHGYWEWYYYDGKLMFKGFFYNGKRVGYEEIYYHDGKLIKKTYNI
jgi:antitoxin component YwqK of YwqJK toxin-antitoxin module